MAGRGSEERLMDRDGGMRAPESRLRHVRSHTIGLRVAIGEDKALNRKGWLR